ncbi:MAG TPA: GntR family transcriptional regulator [Gryllotalpicola sp.]
MTDIESRFTEIPTPSAGKSEPYLRILHAIRDGEFVPNQILTEVWLAEWCGVSRTPIREALSRLISEGLIERTGKGPAVRSRTIDELYNIYETRIVLEAAAARFAAERRTPSDLVLLDAALQRYEGVDAEASPRVVSSARSFHEAVWAAAHNGTLADSLARLDMLVPRLPNDVMSDPAHRERNVAQHREIGEAIEARDGDGASEAATRHYTYMRDARVQAEI